MKRIVMLACIGLIAGCASTDSPPNTTVSKSIGTKPTMASKSKSACEYEKVEGIPFKFSEQPKMLRRYGYPNWSFDNNDSLSAHPDYAGYVNKEGKLNPLPVDGWARTKWYEATLKNCKKVYKKANPTGSLMTLEDLDHGAFGSGFELLGSMETFAESEGQKNKWGSLYEGSSLKYRLENEGEYSEKYVFSNGITIYETVWEKEISPIANKFSDPSDKDIIVNGLARFSLKYDEMDEKLIFNPIYPMGRGNNKYKGSYISASGSIKGDKATMALRLRYRGESWLFAHGVKIKADDFKWTSPKLKFYRDNYKDVWEDTYLNYSTPEIRKLTDNIINSKKVIVRFLGGDYFSELHIVESNDYMIDDLKAIIKAVNLINSKKK